jgi:hypothetical protein
MRPRLRTVVIVAPATLFGLFVVAQLVPYGRDHANPPVLAEPRWSGAETRTLAKRACFDCHSNETRWPWYSHVAPTSWFVQRHVDEGRSELNFSEWTRPQEEADEASEVVQSGEMPPRSYTWLHPSARLSDSERSLLAAGLAATVGKTTNDDDD